MAIENDTGKIGADFHTGLIVKELIIYQYVEKLYSILLIVNC